MCCTLPFIVLVCLLTLNRVAVGIMSCPDDILVDNWDRGLSAAFDVLVTSSLNPSLIVEVGTSSGVAARVAEECKHEKNDEKGSDLGWQCIPIVVEIYDSYWGSEVRQALSQLASRLAVRTNSAKSQMLGSLYGRLTWSGQMPGPS